MLFICDAPDHKTWFAFETEAEAEAESAMMNHAVAKYYHRAISMTKASYRPREGLASIERDIALKGYVARHAPLFLTLRDAEGAGLATAMIPRDRLHEGVDIQGAVIVGPGNADPWPDHTDAISALERHLGVGLPRSHAYPYG